MINPIPYEFVLDYLPTDVIVKKMFGMHYVYRRKMIILILRKRDNQPELNGIWVATIVKHHESLKKEVPAFSPFIVEGYEHQGNWLFIPGDADDLEEAAIKVCEMISHGDTRIGKLTEKPPI